METPALFSNFVMGLASAALVEMGQVDDPIRKERRKNLDAARQHIELLKMLQQKTKGNLNAEESRLIDSVLTDLQLQFAKEKV